MQCIQPNQQREKERKNRNRKKALLPLILDGRRLLLDLSFSASRDELLLLLLALPALAVAGTFFCKNAKCRMRISSASGVEWDSVARGVWCFSKDVDISIPENI